MEARGRHAASPLTNSEETISRPYLAELAARRTPAASGPRIFAPDETVEEREARIREARARLNSLVDVSDDEAEEQRRTGDALLRALAERTGATGTASDDIPAS